MKGKIHERLRIDAKVLLARLPLSSRFYESITERWGFEATVWERLGTRRIPVVAGVEQTLP